MVDYEIIHLPRFVPVGLEVDDGGDLRLQRADLTIIVVESSLQDKEIGPALAEIRDYVEVLWICNTHPSMKEGPLLWCCCGGCGACAYGGE